MAVRKKGWRALVVDERRYFWRAIGTDGGITVVVGTEAAFVQGGTGQQLRLTLGYDHLQTPLGGGAVGLTQRAAVALGVVALAIRHAVASKHGFSGDLGEQDISLPAETVNELQTRARIAPDHAS